MRTPSASLALWCESQGLSSERLKHLTIAVLDRSGSRSAQAACSARLRFVADGNHRRRFARSFRPMKR